MVKIVPPTKPNIDQAAGIIKQGGLIGMPTETVYGLAADATNGEAVAKIYSAKGRPSFNPLISHFASVQDITAHADMDERAKTLASHFWPGPLTLILPRKDTSTIAPIVTADLPTLAVRVPSHKTARALIKASGVPLAAPSANKSGSLSPTSAQHVARSLGDAVDMIFADGSSEIGLESTVVDLSTPETIILRPGGITQNDIQRVLNCDVSVSKESDDIKSPGQLLKHYAPQTPLRLNAIDLQDGEALLAFGSTKFMATQSGTHARDLPDTMIRNLSENLDLHEAASNLFRMLHELDSYGHKGIAVMAIPDQNVGVAINDRLKRAAN